MLLSNPLLAPVRTVPCVRQSPHTQHPRLTSPTSLFPPPLFVVAFINCLVLVRQSTAGTSFISAAAALIVSRRQFAELRRRCWKQKCHGNAKRGQQQGNDEKENQQQQPVCLSLAAASAAESRLVVNSAFFPLILFYLTLPPDGFIDDRPNQQQNDTTSSSSCSNRTDCGWSIGRAV